MISERKPAEDDLVLHQKQEEETQRILRQTIEEEDEPVADDIHHETNLTERGQIIESSPKFNLGNYEDQKPI